VQNLPLGHYDIATETPSVRRLRIAFDDLALSIWASATPRRCSVISREGTTHATVPVGPTNPSVLRGA